MENNNSLITFDIFYYCNFQIGKIRINKDDNKYTVMFINTYR